MATDIQQVWPATVTVFYDPTLITPISYNMPIHPIDSQEVELVNLSESNVEITVHGNGRSIVDPSTHQSGDSCTIGQAKAATRFKYHDESAAWIPLNIDNDFASIAVNTYDLLPTGKIKLTKGNRSVEIISPGTVEIVGPALALRQRLTITNSCSGGADVVMVGDNSILTDLIRLGSPDPVDNFPLLCGETAVLQSFGSYWKVLGITPATLRLQQITVPYELLVGDSLLEVTAGTGKLSLPDPTLFDFTIDRQYRIRNNTGSAIDLISHHALTGYTMTAVDLTGGLWGVTSGSGSSSSFAFLDQTWTSFHADEADDTLHFAMPGQPTSGGNAVPTIKVFVSGLLGVRQFRYFNWDGGASEYVGVWPGIHAAFSDLTWPHAVSIWPVGVVGGNTTLRTATGTAVGTLSVPASSTQHLLLDAVNQEWVVL